MLSRWENIRRSAAGMQFELGIRSWWNKITISVVNFGHHLRLSQEKLKLDILCDSYPLYGVMSDSRMVKSHTFVLCLLANNNYKCGYLY